MFSNKEAWHEGYEQGFAAAEEQINEMIEHLWLDCNSLNAIAGVNLSSKATKCLLSIQAHVIEAVEQIEKLTAERDAAVGDLKELVQWLSLCYACRHKGTYEVCESCSKESEHWEWRGLSLAEKTSDKEVE